MRQTNQNILRQLHQALLGCALLLMPHTTIAQGFVIKGDQKPPPTNAPTEPPKDTFLLHLKNGDTIEVTKVERSSEDWLRYTTFDKVPNPNAKYDRINKRFVLVNPYLYVPFVGSLTRSDLTPECAEKYMPSKKLKVANISDEQIKKQAALYFDRAVKIKIDPMKATPQQRGQVYEEMSAARIAMRHQEQKPYDKNGDNDVDPHLWDEFNVVKKRREQLEENIVADFLLKKYDNNKDGKITEDEVPEILAEYREARPLYSMEKPALFELRKWQIDLKYFDANGDWVTSEVETSIADQFRYATYHKEMGNPPRVIYYKGMLKYEVYE